MILVENKVIIAIMDRCEKVENGLLINGCVYPMGELFEINQPDNIIPQKYCFTNEKGFYINPVWEQSSEQEILRATSALNSSLDSVYATQADLMFEITEIKMGM